MRKLDFAHENKAQISVAVTVKLISSFCFHYKMFSAGYWGSYPILTS